MELLIRNAVVQDYKEIHQLFLEQLMEEDTRKGALYNTAIQKKRLKRELETILADQYGRFFLAIVDDAIVGLIRVTLYEDQSQIIPAEWIGRHAFIAIVIVKKEFQKKGIGKALVERAQEWARHRDAQSIYLEVAEHNKAVLGFYNALGYITEKRMLSKKLQ